MDPYYDDGTCTIYVGDCRDVLPRLDTFDAVMVTDPPYGMAYQSNMAIEGPSEPIAGDESTALRDEVLAWWLPRPALVFGTWRLPRPAGVTQLLIWDKGESPGMGDLSMPWGPGHEEVYVFGTGFTGKRRSNVIRYPMLSPQDLRRPDHPTPKPVGLLIQLVGYCGHGVIVDPFMGSGSTLRAAKDLGRRAIGIETVERYAEMAARSLAQEVLPLFD